MKAKASTEEGAPEAAASPGTKAKRKTKPTLAMAKTLAGEEMTGEAGVAPSRWRRRGEQAQARDGEDAGRQSEEMTGEAGAAPSPTVKPTLKMGMTLADEEGSTAASRASGSQQDAKAPSPVVLGAATLEQ